MKDSSDHSPKVKAFLTKLAEDNSIPTSLKWEGRHRCRRGSHREGILAGTISIPAATSTQLEMVDIRDVRPVLTGKGSCHSCLSELI